MRILACIAGPIYERLELRHDYKEYYVSEKDAKKLLSFIPQGKKLELGFEHTSTPFSSCKVQRSWINANGSVWCDIDIKDNEALLRKTLKAWVYADLSGANGGPGSSDPGGIDVSVTFMRSAMRDITGLDRIDFTKKGALGSTSCYPVSKRDGLAYQWEDWDWDDGSGLNTDEAKQRALKINTRSGLNNNNNNNTRMSADETKQSDARAPTGAAEQSTSATAVDIVRNIVELGCAAPAVITEAINTLERVERGENVPKDETQAALARLRDYHKNIKENTDSLGEQKEATKRKRDENARTNLAALVPVLEGLMDAVKHGLSEEDVKKTKRILSHPDGLYDSKLPEQVVVACANHLSKKPRFEVPAPHAPPAYRAGSSSSSSSSSSSKKKKTVGDEAAEKLLQMYVENGLYGV